MFYKSEDEPCLENYIDYLGSDSSIFLDTLVVKRSKHERLGDRFLKCIISGQHVFKLKFVILANPSHFMVLYKSIQVMKIYVTFQLGNETSSYRSVGWARKCIYIHIICPVNLDRGRENFKIEQIYFVYHISLSSVSLQPEQFDKDKLFRFC